MVMVDAAILESNDLPVPRCSQYTTMKLFSSGALKYRRRRISGKPGPPCTRIKSGLATLSPRIITH